MTISQARHFRWTVVQEGENIVANGSGIINPIALVLGAIANTTGGF